MNGIIFSDKFQTIFQYQHFILQPWQASFTKLNRTRSLRSLWLPTSSSCLLRFVYVSFLGLYLLRTNFFPWINTAALNFLSVVFFCDIINWGLSVCLCTSADMVSWFTDFWRWEYATTSGTSKLSMRQKGERIILISEMVKTPKDTRMGRRPSRRWPRFFSTFTNWHAL